MTPTQLKELEADLRERAKSYGERCVRDNFGTAPMTLTRKPRLSTIQAKKEVLDYLITTLDYIESNMPEDLFEVDGEERQPSDIVRILSSIRVLREEFMRRSRPKKVRVRDKKPITRKDLDRAQAFLHRAHAKMDREAKAREKYGDGILAEYFIGLTDGIHALLPTEK